MTKEQKEYLDNLRDGGTINMFEAPMHLVWEFGLSKHEARAIVSEWIASNK